jgi:hypothetical protein
MRQLDSGKRDGGISKRLETHHRGAAALDRTMILLNDVVEVATTPHSYVLPLRILASQEPQRRVTRRVAVECHLARPAWQAASQRFAEECLCGRNATIRAKQKVYRLAVLVPSAGIRSCAWTEP